MVTHMNLGDIVQISNDSYYQDVFGIYLGYRLSEKWDPEIKYRFHMILSNEGSLKEFCIPAGKEYDLFKIVCKS